MTGRKKRFYLLVSLDHRDTGPDAGLPVPADRWGGCGPALSGHRGHPGNGAQFYPRKGGARHKRTTMPDCRNVFSDKGTRSATRQRIAIGQARETVEAEYQPYASVKHIMDTHPNS